jgi:hypothetical protein
VVAALVVCLLLRRRPFAIGGPAFEQALKTVTAGIVLIGINAVQRFAFGPLSQVFNKVLKALRTLPVLTDLHSAATVDLVSHVFRIEAAPNHRNIGIVRVLPFLRVVAVLVRWTGLAHAMTDMATRARVRALRHQAVAQHDGSPSTVTSANPPDKGTNQSRATHPVANR